MECLQVVKGQEQFYCSFKTLAEAQECVDLMNKLGRSWMKEAIMKTREEVEALKKIWQNDPIWDIEHTEGF